MVTHNLHVQAPIKSVRRLNITSALHYLNITSAQAERVMRVVTAWAQGQRPRDIQGHEQILRHIPGITENSDSTEQLRQAIGRVLSDKHKFTGNVESTSWSGTDIFGNLRVNQCLKTVALSTLVRPLTAKWLALRWETLDVQSRFAILLILFYAGSNEAVRFLETAGDTNAAGTYAAMREQQLQSDSWIIRNALYNLVGPAPGGGIDIEPTLGMRTIVLFVRDLAIPIATIIGMIAVIATSKGWANNIGTNLAITSAAISFIDIVMISLWNKVVPGTLDEWHVFGQTRISSLSKKISIKSETLEMYNLAGVAATFSGTVRRTATGPTSCWAPDTGEVGFHSMEPVDVNVLAQWGLVWGYDRTVRGAIMLRNVYGRSTCVELEVIEELGAVGSQNWHSYHMPSSGDIMERPAGHHGLLK
ncbi:hypothetical protein V1509DRAFT_374017 [Lipomyces kononenkoae]